MCPLNCSRSVEEGKEAKKQQQKKKKKKKEEGGGGGRGRSRDYRRNAAHKHQGKVQEKYRKSTSKAAMAVLDKIKVPENFLEVAGESCKGS